MMDEDFAEMTRDHLITEVKKLRQGIREIKYRQSLDEQAPEAARTKEQYQA